MTRNSEPSALDNGDLDEKAAHTPPRTDPRSMFESAMVAQRAGDLATATALLRQVTQIAPRVEVGFFNLGNVLFQTGDFLEAAAAYRSALSLERSAQTFNNLGNALAAADRWDEAVTVYRDGLGSSPPPQAASRLSRNLAQALERTDRLSEALDYLLAIQEPFQSEAGNLEAIVRLLTRLRRKQELSSAMHRLLQHSARPPALEVTLARAYRLLGDVGSALKHAVEAMSLDPENAAALSVMGELNMSRGRHGEATVCLHRAMSLGLRDAQVHSQWLQSLVYQGHNIGDRFLEEARRWAEMHGQRPSSVEPSSSGETAEHRSAGTSLPLRVGFLLSSDDLLFIRSIGSVIRCFDHERIVPICYLDDAAADCADLWASSTAGEVRPVSHLSDVSLKKRIHDDRVDVLVDTTGHAGVNRLSILAQSIVPLHVAWGADFATTGLSSMRAMLSDEVVVPLEFEMLFTEPLLKLNQPSFSLPPNLLASESAELAGNAQKANGDGANTSPVVFGLLCPARAVTIDTIHHCAAILSEHPDAILRIGHATFRDTAVVKEITTRFEEDGTDVRRLQFETIVTDAEHVDFLRAIHMLIDPHPVGSPIAAALALRLGTPVVCIKGKQPSARRTAAVLNHLGLDDWISESVEDCRTRIRSILDQRRTDSDLSQRLESALRDAKLFRPETLARRLEELLFDLTAQSSPPR